jgi:hypothetical protein
LPERAHCATCRAEVMLVEIRGKVVACDVQEIISRRRCPVCRGLGRLYGEACQRCHGEKTIGELAPLRAIAVDEDGSARYWKRARPRDLRRGRQNGEGLYHRHRCP